MARVFAMSDLHVDYVENMRHMLSLSQRVFVEDTLILAGDVCDSLQRLSVLLDGMKQKFREVCFVPGNHEPMDSRHQR